MKPVAPQFTFDVTTERPDASLSGLVEFIVEQAEAYLRAHPDAEAWAIRLTVVPIGGNE